MKAVRTLLAVVLGLAACQPGTPSPQESPHPLRTARQVPGGAQ